MSDHLAILRTYADHRRGMPADTGRQASITAALDATIAEVVRLRVALSEFVAAHEAVGGRAPTEDEMLRIGRAHLQALEVLDGVRT